MIGDNTEGINPAAGFGNFGNVKNEFLLLAGSVPGPMKRLIGIRAAIRNSPASKHNLEDITYFSTSEGKKPASKPKGTEVVKEEAKAKAVKGEVKKEAGKKEESKDVKTGKKEAKSTDKKDATKKEGKK